MALKFDDFLSKKKEPAQVLDLSRVKISTKEDFKKYFDKIPEYKIKPEKVLPEMIKIRDKEFSLIPSRREGRVPDYNYLDPTPPDMKGVNLTDLCPVSIDWKMLTTQRPKTKQEEDMFSRLVQLGKLELKYQQRLKKSKDSDWIRKTKNPRSSIVETRVLSCKDCGEDFCDSTSCGKLMYENFFRIQPSIATGIVKDASIEGGDDTEKEGRKRKRRGRTRTRGVRRRKPRKNSIFNRPASKGCNRDHSKRERLAAGIMAERSASQDRCRSNIRQRSCSPPQRAKSAPRIHFKGLSSDEETSRGRKKRKCVSSSGASHSEYSSQSESESPSRKVDFDEDKERSGILKKSRRSFVRNCTLCDYSQQTTSPRSIKEFGDTTSDDSDSSPSHHPHKKLLPAATIQLEFNPDATYTKPPIATALPRSSTIARRSQFVQQQEVKALVTGLSRIELAFADEEVEDPPVRIRRRLRVQKSARPKTGIDKRPASCLQGKGLLTKDIP